MAIHTIAVTTSGERFYEITKDVNNSLKALLEELPHEKRSGMLHLFVMHTSCALTIGESFESSARIDMENFLKHIAPQNLGFISHTSEGPDDSPSHMKSILLNQNMNLIVEKGELLLGKWQGIFLSEFRENKQNRKVIAKFISD